MPNDESPLVLIVDDTPHNLQVAGEILSRENFRIALAQSGPDAIRFLEKRKPDIILLDIMMPEIDGFRVCQYLKENLETRFIPVIFLTARAQIEDIIKGFEIGGADYLTKPFNDRELVARVKAQLELVRLQEMLRDKNRRLLEEIRLRKQREQDLVDYEKGRYVGVLAGGIAHEFNNLLQVILGYGELIDETLAPGSEEKLLQTEVLDAGRRAAKMVEQLLLFADRRPKRNVEKLDLVKFVEDRISLFKGIFSEKININFDLPDKALPVVADRAELAQVMINLLLNASEVLSDEGKIDVKIYEFVIDDECAKKFNIEKGKSFVAIDVEDNGRGLTSTQLERINEPIVSINNEEGIELGLGVVKAVVKQLGGQVEITSQPEEGTVCRLLIPNAGEAMVKSRFFKPSADSKITSGNGETILLAEDEEQVLFLEKKILEKHGYRVLEARNGEEAIEIFAKYQNEIKLVLLDIGMPVKNGIEAGKVIESMGGDARVVYCTAYTDKHFEEVAEKELILQKPFEKNEIVSLINETIHSA